MNELFYNTVNPTLKSILHDLMQAKEFMSFRLVGGTSLSLQIGHRISVDIDLFTDAPYESVDFDAIHQYLRSNYDYVSSQKKDVIGFGTSFFVGDSVQNAVKLDLYYTDEFMFGQKLIDGIRLASIEEIIAMKLCVIGQGGRKKDFWDIHAVSTEYSFSDMVELYLKRYPYEYSKEEIKVAMQNFNAADVDFEPECLKGNVWELIKLDIVDWVKKNGNNDRFIFL